MSDGRPICPDFNKGTCTADPCAKGLHACNVLCKTGRTCGMTNHCALNCFNKKVSIFFNQLNPVQAFRKKELNQQRKREEMLKKTLGALGIFHC